MTGGVNASGGPSSARAAAPRCALPMPPDPAPGSAKPRPASGAAAGPHWAVVLAIIGLATLPLGCRRGREAPLFTGEPYLAVWAGDADRKSSDFLAILDADPTSATYQGAAHLSRALARQRAAQRERRAARRS